MITNKILAPNNQLFKELIVWCYNLAEHYLQRLIIVIVTAVSIVVAVTGLGMLIEHPISSSSGVRSNAVPIISSNIILFRFFSIVEIDNFLI